MDSKYAALCKSAKIAEGKLNKEFLFTVECADHFYFNKNIGENNIRDGFVDGAGDGGIDFILTGEDELYLLQGKSSENISINDIKAIINKVIITIEKIEKNQTKGLNEHLVSTYINAYDSLPDDKKINIVLFTNATLSKDTRKQINEIKEMSDFAKYNIIVYDKIEIEAKKETTTEEYVENYKLDLTEASNVLHYGENGCIVNVSANSLKRLYMAKCKSGLFSYNLREHIKQANVDDGINRTIQKEPDKFWFYNNGVTIGCEDYDISGNTVKLYNFSIINGAQTTTNIGKSDDVNEKNDFAVVCKIVKPSGSLKSDYDFLSRISEASNSQKQIKPRDLKSNLPEQRLLQNKAAKNERPLAIEIKRGVRPDNYGNVSPWQRVTNDLIGQLILSCILQRPGDAKTSSSAIFDNSNIYVPVFRRTHDYNTLSDLVKLYDEFENFRGPYESEIDDIDKISVSKAGRFTIFAMICYLIKKFRKTITSRRDPELTEDNLSGDIFNYDYDGDDFERKLSNLFKILIKIINNIYQTKKGDLKLTSHASFLKNDSYYTEYILKELEEYLDDDDDLEKIKNYMKIFKI